MSTTETADVIKVVYDAHSTQLSKTMDTQAKPAGQ